MTVRELYLLLEGAERDYQAIANEVLESDRYQAIEIRGKLKQG